MQRNLRRAAAGLAVVVVLGLGMLGAGAGRSGGTAGLERDSDGAVEGKRSLASDTVASKAGSDEAVGRDGLREGSSKQTEERAGDSARLAAPTADKERLRTNTRSDGPAATRDESLPGGRERERPESPASGGLKDRTNWGGSLGEQLNRDLMPLVDECIEMAGERRPTMTGMLAISLLVVPTDRPHEAVIGRVEATVNNEIDDPELFECIEQSTFTLEGLDAPSNFVITIPIEPPNGSETRDDDAEGDGALVR